MTKVRLERGIYEVIDVKTNIEMFNNKEYDSFFVRCNPEETNLGLPMALVDKKDVIEVLNDE